jgi:RNA polymerase sigma factor (sigma-70 family)
MQATLETIDAPQSFSGVRSAREAADPFREINLPAFLSTLVSKGPEGARAFRLLVEATYPHLLRYAGGYLHSRDQAQDAVQETYLAAHRALPRFQGRCKLSTWMYSLAYHKICDRLSEKYREGYASRDCGEAAEAPAAELSPDEALHQARLLERIRAAAQALPALYREAYRLRDQEGLSGEEAAAELGIAPTLVRVRLHRARRMIVDCLRETHPQGLEGSSLF